MMKKHPIAEYNDPCSIPIWQSGIAGSHLPCVICLVLQGEEYQCWERMLLC